MGLFYVQTHTIAVRSFRIQIEIEKGYRYYQVDEVFNGVSFENFKVFETDKFIILQGNHSLFRVKGLKHRRPTWKILQGGVKYPRELELTIDEIMKVVDV